MFSFFLQLTSARDKSWAGVTKRSRFDRPRLATWTVCSCTRKHRSWSFSARGTTRWLLSFSQPNEHLFIARFQLLFYCCRFSSRQSAVARAARSTSWLSTSPASSTGDCRHLVTSLLFSTAVMLPHDRWPSKAVHTLIAPHKNRSGTRSFAFVTS